MIKYEKASCCGSILEKDGLCDCETLYVSQYEKCPECGCNTYAYNDPGRDPSMETRCTNSDCKYRYTQFLDWEDIKELSGN